MYDFYGTAPIKLGRSTVEIFSYIGCKRASLGWALQDSEHSFVFFRNGLRAAGIIWLQNKSRRLLYGWAKLAISNRLVMYVLNKYVVQENVFHVDNIQTHNRGRSFGTCNQELALGDLWLSETYNYWSVNENCTTDFFKRIRWLAKNYLQIVLLFLKKIDNNLFPKNLPITSQESC
jgi:hypothetical protein